MSDGPHPWWDSVSAAELDYSKTVVERLKDVGWAQPVLNHARVRGSLPSQIQKHGAATPENLSDLFELRFAYELMLSGTEAQYEFEAGVGQTSVDFRVAWPGEWLVELVCLRTTQAIKSATQGRNCATGVQMFGHYLSSDSNAKGNSLQEEMVVAEGKIGEKVLSGGQPTKFPEPRGGYHVIVSDMRGFGGSGGGEWDEYVQMSVGASGLPEEDRSFALCLPGTRRPIKGLFEPSNPLPAATAIRERIHFLGFVAEKHFGEGEITRALMLFNNPFLFADADAVRSAWGIFPLKGARAYRPVLLPKRLI